MQELSSAGAIRDADPVTKAAHVQRLQGMAEEIKAMMGALNGNKNNGTGGVESGRREDENEEEDEEEQLYVNIGSIMNMNKGKRATMI